MDLLVQTMVAVVGGAFAVFGYLLQKRQERCDLLANERRDAYIKYFDEMFKQIDKRRQGAEGSSAEEILAKTRVLLFASDHVIGKLGALNAHISSAACTETAGEQIHDAFDELLLAMRTEIVAGTHSTLDDIRRSSPLLRDARND
jgi:hypothetical protein